MTVGRPSSPRGVERRDADCLSPWLYRHAAVMLLAVALTVALRSGLWVALAALVSFAELGYRERAPLALLKPYGGYANQLTALRLALLMTAAVLMNQLADAWLLLLLAANVAVDVADGRVARRTGQVSRFGAVFDREVDAVFVLVAYLYFFVAQGFPAWVLIPGLLPYVYRLCTLARRSKPAPEHRERLAPFLAGTNFLVLLIAVGVPQELKAHAVLLSAALVSVSFLVSFVSLHLNENSAS